MPITIHESPSGNPVVIPDPIVPPDPPAVAIARETFRAWQLPDNDIANLDIILNTGSGEVMVEITNPRPTKLYSGEVGCDLFWFAANPAVMPSAQLILEASVDLGAWATVGNGALVLPSPGEANGNHRFCCAFSPRTGASLGIAANSTSLRMRVRALGVTNAGQLYINSAGGTADSGTLVTTLTERNP